MASRSMALDVLVRLRDQLSGPMRRLKSNLQSLAGFARKIGVLGTAIAAISFMGPVQEAGAFQQKLLDIAGTAELSGKAAFKFVDQAKSEYEELAFKIGQTSDIIASGSGQMIAAGVNRDLIDATIDDIGRAATAANAEFSDMASVATSMLNNLKLPADQMKDSLGALVTAGKEGSFELKDMSKYFPQLTSQAAKFGVKGREAVNFLASSLQIAMKGASDPSIAANNFNNFLSKALSPRTVKNFANMGVDIQAVMQDAAAKGINPLEAMLQKVGKLTGVGEKEIGKYMQAAKKNGLEGADALAYVRQQLEAIGAAGKVSELFSDQQVLDFIVPFMANVQEYKDIKSKVSAATGAAIDADFDTQMQGINRQLGIFREIGTQSVRQVGFAFAEWLPMINEWLITGLTWMREFDAATGGWMKTIITGAGGIILLVTAVGALGLVLPIIGAGFSALLALIGVLFSPLGVIIGLMAGAGALIYKNWDKVKPGLMKFWDSLKGGASKAWDGMKRVWSKAQPYMSQIWSKVSDGAVRAWDWVADAAPRAWSRISSSASSIFANIDFDKLKVGSLQALEGVFNTLSKAWENLKQIGEGIGPSLGNIGTSLKNAFGSMGETWNDLGRLGSSLANLANSLFTLMGFDEAKGNGIFKAIGTLLGGLGEMVGIGIEGLARAIAMIAKGLADLAKWAETGQAPDWLKWFPEKAGQVVRYLADGVEKLWGVLQTAIQMPVLAWDTLANGFEAVYTKIVGWLEKIAGWIDRVKSAISSLGTMNTGNGLTPAGALGKEVGGMFKPSLPANNNAPASPTTSSPEKHGSLQPARGGQKFAALSSSQNVNVGGDIRIKVDGPGKVTSASSSNSKVALSTDRGRTIGAA